MASFEPVNPKHRGDFTALAKSHGMSVQEFAKHVMANTDMFSAHVIHMAMFAKNAKSWNH